MYKWSDEHYERINHAYVDDPIESRLQLKVLATDEFVII